MSHQSLKTKLTLLIPLATSVLAVLILYAIHFVFRSNADQVTHAPTLSDPYSFQPSFHISAIFLLPFFFLTVRLLQVRMAKPLFEFIAQAERLYSCPFPGQFIPATDSPEILKLSNSFNNLITQLDTQRQRAETCETRSRTFDEQDLANQSCMENLRLQNDQLRALHEIAMALGGMLEIQSLLSELIGRAANLMNTQHGFIYLLNDSNTAMEMRMKLGYFEVPDFHSLKRGEGIAGHVWELASPYVTTDHQQWANLCSDSHVSLLKVTIAVPLTFGQDVIGVIGLASTCNDGSFDNNNIVLMQQIAELASLFLSNARLYESAKKELNEHTRSDDQLRKLSHAVMQSPVSILITDLKGNIEFANPHLTHLTGYRPEELLGQNPRILKSGLTSRAKYQNLWDTIRAGAEWRGELQNRKKNGQLYWERILISPVRDHNGELTHFIAIKEDISDFKIMENQLRHTQKMESIGQLAGGVAHDFNNILTAIIGYGNILLMKSPPESPVLQTVEQILAAAERGASLTQGLLTFNRNQASNPVAMDLNAVIERVETLILSLIGDNCTLVVTLSQHPVSVMADSIQMEQILINLAANVRDAMPEGCTVTISTESVTLDEAFTSSHGIGAKGSYALLTISDNGPGMDDEAIQRIFDPFNSTRSTGTNTGLGLSIVYGIVKRHHGHIICTSKPHVGTDFRIYLPLVEEAVVVAAPQIMAQHATPSRTSILMGNSDTSSSSLTKNFLEEFGYTVIVANNADMLLDIYPKLCNSICLVILDGIISGAKGIKTFREIKSIIPVSQILVCAEPHDSTFKQLRALVSNIQFLIKPFPPKELLMKIKEVTHDAP